MNDTRINDQTHMNDTIPAPAAVPPPPPAPTPNAPTPDPVAAPLFAQAKGESDRAFEAFRVYLELGPRRRYAAVGPKVGTCMRTIHRWAKDFDWGGRIKTCAARAAEQYVETEQA